MHISISHAKSFNTHVSTARATLAQMINVYEICVNTTHSPIFNMQGFICCRWTSILDCFGQLASLPGYSVTYNTNVLKIEYHAVGDIS